MTRSPSPTKTEIGILESVSEEPDLTETTEILGARKKRRTRSITKSPSPVKTIETKHLDVLVEEPDATTKNTESEIETTELTVSTKEENEKHTTAKDEPHTSPTKLVTASQAQTAEVKPTALKTENVDAAKQKAESQSNVSINENESDVIDRPELPIAVSDTDKTSTELAKQENPPDNKDSAPLKNEKVCLLYI